MYKILMDIATTNVGRCGNKAERRRNVNTIKKRMKFKWIRNSDKNIF